MVEHKIIIVDRITDGIQSHHGIVIAEFKLGILNNFENIFTTPIDFDLYIDGGDTITREDKYGSHCKMASISTVLRELTKYNAENSYRRLKPCIGLLLGFDEKEWNDLEVVHYGY